MILSKSHQRRYYKDRMVITESWKLEEHRACTRPMAKHEGDLPPSIVPLVKLESTE